jgi:hypothetical protein
VEREEIVTEGERESWPGCGPRLSMAFIANGLVVKEDILRKFDSMIWARLLLGPRRRARQSFRRGVWSVGFLPTCVGDRRRCQ